MATKTKKLSARAELLLRIIDDHTERDWDTGRLGRFFVPSAGAYYYWDDDRSESTYISGSGDASALAGLERRGFIERPTTNLPNDYMYALTEDGLLYLEQSGVRARITFGH